MDKRVSILKVANGYICTVEPDMNSMMRVPLDYTLQARAMKKEFLGGDVMDGLKEQNEQEEEESNVFIFKSIDEVLSFIKFKMSNG